MKLVAYRVLDNASVLHAEPHAHAEGQLFVVTAGVVSVDTGAGRWVMPPRTIGWVPPWVRHGARRHGHLAGASLYLDEASARHLPAALEVVRVTPLLEALLDELPRLAATPAVRTHYLRAMADAFTRAPATRSFVPMPRDPRLAALATRLIADPSDATRLDGLARRCGMSRRTLTRRFAEDTGVSLGQWRRHMRLCSAHQRLAAGASVTSVALDCGYQSASSFIAVFRAYFGTTPAAWAAQRSR